MIVFSNERLLIPVLYLLGAKIVFGPLVILVSIIFYIFICTFYYTCSKPVLRNMSKDPWKAVQCLGILYRTNFLNLLLLTLISLLLTRIILEIWIFLIQYRSIILIVPMKNLVILVLFFKNWNNMTSLSRCFYYSKFSFNNFFVHFLINKTESRQESSRK